MKLDFKLKKKSLVKLSDDIELVPDGMTPNVNGGNPTETCVCDISDGCATDPTWDGWPPPPPEEETD